MFIELFAGTSRRDEGAGQWTEWREDPRAGQTVVFANAGLRRVGICPLFQLDPAQSFPVVSPRFNIDGGIADNPLDPGQAPLPEEAELDQ